MKKSRVFLLSYALLVSSVFLNCQSSPKVDKEPAPTVENKVISETPGFENIDVPVFQEKMKQEDIVILDVRTPAETKMGIISGAVVIDIQQPGFKEKIAQLNKDKTYLVYCKSGIRSSQACKMMEEFGFGHVFNLKGGYVAWTSKK